MYLRCRFPPRIFKLPSSQSVSLDDFFCDVGMANQPRPMRVALDDHLCCPALAQASVLRLNAPHSVCQRLWSVLKRYGCARRQKRHPKSTLTPSLHANPRESISAVLFNLSTIQRQSLLLDPWNIFSLEVLLSEVPFSRPCSRSTKELLLLLLKTDPMVASQATERAASTRMDLGAALDKAVSDATRAIQSNANAKHLLETQHRVPHVFVTPLRLVCVDDHLMPSNRMVRHFSHVSV